jgi:hypothetical protein
MIDQSAPRLTAQEAAGAPENEGVPIPFHRSTRPKRCYTVAHVKYRGAASKRRIYLRIGVI